MQEILDALHAFGLSEKEATAYLASLELGEAGANDIALKGNLPRTLTYDLLERLIDLGLVSYAIKGMRKYYRAADPHELYSILRKKEEAVRNVMPALDKINAMKGIARPRVEVYEGKDGMKTIMNDILRSKAKEFMAYGSSRSSFSVIPAFMEEWHQERIKKRIVMKIIYNDTPQARQRIKGRPRSLAMTNYRFMPVTLESPTATIISGDKVILQSWTKEPFAIVVENNEMAENHRRYFEHLWKEAQK